ncbi:MAG: GNAT superfamily N-acetyltransferase [Kiritimatiellia bacterium]|jgi:GNAT superfamily N-acetyltransferase
MIEITPYRPALFENAIDIFTQLSAYYLKDNASDSKTVANNLKDNVLADGSAMDVVLAYCDQRVCGLAAYTIMYPATKETGQLFLKELFINPEYTRKGIGEKMMSYLANVALEKNCSRFDWTSNKDSVSATQFYEKIGAPIIQKKKYYRLSGDKLQDVANGVYDSPI